LKALRFALLACLLGLFTLASVGCATAASVGGATLSSVGGATTSEADPEPAKSASTPTPPNLDPWEPMNRSLFAFNEALDKYALEPVATAWDFVLPSFVQTGIGNVFAHVNLPIVFANDLLQLKPKAAVEDVARFVQNSVFGLGGLIDVASMVEIPKNDEDFGQTLGYWGVPPGPYLIVPILGPYTLRDGIGEIIDTAASSYAYFTPFWYDVGGLNGIETFGASVGVKGLELLNLRAIYLEELEASKNDAFDYYTFVRSAYLQNRRAKVLDRTDVPANDEDELYFGDEPDDDFEDEDEDYDDY
jgi:phospholipid-binding lipoprotein MlaA